MSFDEEHLEDHYECQREVAERDARIRELEARVAELEAAITDHNTGCELSCGRQNEYNAKSFGCEAYLSRGMQCPDCPMDDLIAIEPPKEST